MLDALAREAGAAFTRRGRMRLWRGDIAGVETILLEPLTYMNLGGEAVAELLASLAEEPPLADLLVVADDVHLPLGRMRFRAGGSSGGHNGLASVEAALASRDYPRLRVGVGSGTAVDGEALIDFVLGRFDAVEETVLAEVVPAAAAAVRLWLRADLAACQDRYNGYQAPAAVRRETEEREDPPGARA